jgi:hypothetical protein
MFIFAALAMMEMLVKQTFMWFVLLLAFVVKGSNLEVTVDNFICFPLHAQTFYLRSVLKHQAIHLKKVWYGLSRVDEVFRTCVVSVQLILLLREAVWNRLMCTSPLSKSSVKYLMTRFPVDVQLILSFRVNPLFLSTSFRTSAAAPRLHEFDGRPLLKRYWRLSRPSLNLWNHSKDTHTGERASFPRTVWSICLFFHAFSCVWNQSWLLSRCSIATEK